MEPARAPITATEIGTLHDEFSLNRKLASARTAIRWAQAQSDFWAREAQNQLTIALTARRELRRLALPERQ